MSIATGGTEANNHSFASSISETGRWVVFGSIASNLIASDTNQYRGIFIRDRVLGTTRRVSVDTNGNEANGPSSSTSISADGRFVAFESYASNLVVGDNNNNIDIFVRDQVTGAIERVSVDSNGIEVNDFSRSPSLSPDGRWVTFESFASNLVPNDFNNTIDVFIYDRLTKDIIRVSVASGGIESNGASSAASISADGQWVAFVSSADNLVAGDSNQTFDIFVHHRMTQTTQRVSISTIGIEGNDFSHSPRISEDGRLITFSSRASNLVDNDTNTVSDVFVHDRIKGITDRVSLASDGRQPSGQSASSTISANGRWFGFVSHANNLVSNDVNKTSDVFIHDRKTGKTQQVSIKKGGGGGNGLVGSASISGDGRYLVFSTGSDNLVADDTNRQSDVFLSGPGFIFNDDVIVNFNNLGLFARLNGPAWLKLHTVHPDLFFLGDFDDNGQSDIVAYFSVYQGLYIRRNLSAWTLLHRSPVSAIAIDDLDKNGQDDMIIAFPGLGLFARMNDKVWCKLNQLVPDELLTADIDGNGKTDIVTEFSSTLGGVYILRNQQNWEKLISLTPITMTKGEISINSLDELIFSFEKIPGVFAFVDNNQWIRLHSKSANQIHSAVASLLIFVHSQSEGDNIMLPVSIFVDASLHTPVVLSC